MVGNPTCNLQISSLRDNHSATLLLGVILCRIRTSVTGHFTDPLLDPMISTIEHKKPKETIIIVCFGHVKKSHAIRKASIMLIVTRRTTKTPDLNTKHTEHPSNTNPNKTWIVLCKTNTKTNASFYFAAVFPFKGNLRGIYGNLGQETKYLGDCIEKVISENNKPAKWIFSFEDIDNTRDKTELVTTSPV
ncbi:hypothetical protein ElyMa_003040600 [Elysia marginata]|uniref:Uncharacterized protein n=1 Tax=Elysia marginata TaxID=1093978 RepID=A0AAV4IL45_9GAST|nr:hypothetical protein ElyMa_003040600 [Elysia marginata]